MGIRKGRGVGRVNQNQLCLKIYIEKHMLLHLKKKNIVRRYNGRHMLRKMGMNTEG